MNKRRNKTLKPIGYLVLGSVGSSLIGSKMPENSGSPLLVVGKTTSKFIPPAAVLSGGLITLNQLKKLKEENLMAKKRRKKKKR